MMRAKSKLQKILFIAFDFDIPICKALNQHNSVRGVTQEAVYLWWNSIGEGLLQTELHCLVSLWLLAYIMVGYIYDRIII